MVLAVIYLHNLSARLDLPRGFKIFLSIYMVVGISIACTLAHTHTHTHTHTGRYGIVYLSIMPMPLQLLPAITFGALSVCREEEEEDRIVFRARAQARRHSTLDATLQYHA